MVERRYGRNMGDELVVYGWDSLSTNDGPGMRFALYLKGCSLSCPWCLNPYLQRIEPEIKWKSESCIFDNCCVESCECGALQRRDEHIEVDYAVCNFCGSCWNSCVRGSLRPVGEYVSVDRVVSLILQQTVAQVPPKKVTIGGGEPLLQGSATINLIRALKGEGMVVYLTTCGGIEDKVIWEKGLELVDGVLLHVLTLDESEWLEFGGRNFDFFLRNVYALRISEKPVYIRLPIVPGYTDCIEKVQSIMVFIQENIPGIVEVELRVYTPDSRFSLPMFKLRDKAISTEQVVGLCESLRKMGIEKVHWRGSARRI